MAPLSIAPEVSRQHLVDWLQRFVRYPSTQTELLEDDPAVRGFVSECALPLAQELGLEPRLDASGNMIVTLGARESDRHLMFMTYAMTHPAASMTDPFAGELLTRDGHQVVRGRGLSEQKSGLVAALAAVHARHRRGALSGALSFVLSTAGETGRHRAAEAILKALDRTPQLGVVVVGSSGKIGLGNKGRIDIEITVRGTASHSARPWAGLNAITGAQQVLQRLAAFDVGAAEHPGLGRATLTSTAIESFPKATHTVQNEVRMTFDLRLLPGQDPDERFALVRDALADVAPWPVTITKGAFMYPCEVAEDSDLVRHILAGHRAAGLPRPGVYHSDGALDAGFLARNGCAATMWGPGAVEMFHTDEESVPVDDVWNSANAYLGLIQSYLG